MKDIIEQIYNDIKNYQAGDLLSLINISENFDYLIKNFNNSENLKIFSEIVEKLKIVLLKLSEFPDKTEQIKYLIIIFFENFLKFFNNEIEERFIFGLYKEKENLIKELISLEKKVIKKELYPEDYFDNIVKDKNLLIQFVNETKEHLDEAQFVLIELEYDSKNKELIGTLFRDFHTIKGSSAFLGLRNIEEISHKIEDILALVRDDKLLLTKELIDLIFIGIEFLRNLNDVILNEEGNSEKLKEIYKKINIFNFINLMNKIKSEYEIKKIGEILIEEGFLNKKDLQKLLEIQKAENKLLGEIAVENKILTGDQLNDILRQQQQQKLKVKRSGFVKVSNEKLNTLIDLVGELVINQSMLKQEILSSIDYLKISERNLNQLENITTMIKNIVLSMGMVPIADTFNKLRVVIRNTSESLNKYVIVETEGEETELDRNVIEMIYDPLIHIVRNAIDHGIETPEERIKSKKDKMGKIILKAEHKGSGIEISIWDDGRGIDKDKIIKKALEKRLYTKEEIEKLSEKDIFSILFLPGFSTSEKVTNLSGRGVGLDIVKKNIEELRGKVEIHSEKGKYTEFIIKLPLTLAIIEGFVTKIGENKYIFPFNLIEEILVIDKNDLKFSEDKKNAVIYHRNLYIPVIFTDKVFNENSSFMEKEKIISLIIQVDNLKYLIPVDEVIGKQEIVIKNLGTLLSKYNYFSGGTIFGDGTIGFVVDIEGLIEKASLL